MTIKSHRSIELLFGGELKDGHSVPATVFTSSMDGLQRTIELLGMEYEGKEVKIRAKASEEIKRKYAVFLSPPREGSYVAPAVIGDTGYKFFDEGDVGYVAGRFRDVLNLISQNDIKGLRRLIPDGIWRTNVVNAVKKILPSKKTGVTLKIYDYTDTVILNGTTSDIYHFVDDVLSFQENEDTRTVTGVLIAMEFEKRKFTIRYPVTKKELDCYYIEGTQSLLMDNALEFIHVTGTVTLDEEGHPKTITNVDDVSAVDLSPINISEFTSGPDVIIAKEPIEFIPELDDTSQLLTVEHFILDIYLVASTREDLERNIEEELDLLWRNFALEDDDKLTEAAIHIKEAMLENFEVKNAT